MISSVKGKIKNKLENNIIIDIGSFSLIITLSKRSINLLPNSINKEVEILTYLNVREDALELYGFLDIKEMDLFKKLIGISKIGPKMAITILSDTDPNQLIKDINFNNVSEITKISRIGKKTAERIILELKDKLNLNLISNQELDQNENSNLYSDVLRSLVSLGINRVDVERVLKEMKSDNEFDGKIEKIIKKALSRL